ncbi:MAG TPA: hypothetical protein PLU17_02025, partial [Chitinophagaceae bacterium]|nr:hypothetical protein [Chitinophagaceae bacterium]
IEFPDQSIKEVKGDYFIMAVPVEQAANLISDEMMNADHTLGYIKTLAPSVSWMNGIQFYLNEDVIINEGHVIYSDSQWAVTSISQVQFWNDYDITTKGNGNIKGVLSVDISDWKTPGKFTTDKWAAHCTRKEVADEVWEQLKHSLNIPGKLDVLRDEMRVDWFLDRDIHEKATQHNDSIKWDGVEAEVWATLNKNLDEDARETLKNDKTVNWVIDNDIKDLQSITDISLSMLDNREPLLVNNVSTWGLRPDANCGIPNLFFASDYVRTHTDLATMEGANEAARRAVNCLLDIDKSTASKCKIWPLKEPFIFKPLKWYDTKRWNNGLPWTMHIPWWLKLFMIPWTAIYLLIFFFNWIKSKF